MMLVSLVLFQPIRHLLILGALLAFSLPTLAAGHPLGEGEASSKHRGPRSLEEIRNSGELVLLTFPHQNNVFARTNLTQGAMPKKAGADRFLGIDIDLARQFARSLGVEVTVRPVSQPRYSALIPDLLAGRGDLIASSFSITEERKEKVDFSHPYYAVQQVVVASRDFAIQGPEDLGALMTAVPVGSSHVGHLLRLGVDPAQIVYVDFTIEAYSALADDRVDFVLGDSTSAQISLLEMPNFHIALTLPGEDHYAFALPKGSELMPLLNQFLDEAQRTGELDDLIDTNMRRMAATKTSMEW